MSDSLDHLLQRWEKEAGTETTSELLVGALRVPIRTNEPRLLPRLRSAFAAFATGSSSFLETGARIKTCDVFVIQSSSPALPGHFESEAPSSGRPPAKNIIRTTSSWRIVRKPRTGMLFALRRDRILAVGDCLAHLNQVVNLLVAQVIAHALSDSALLCHAAAVALRRPGALEKDAGLVLAARSGSGKSTLCLSLLERGLHFVSNDRVLIWNRPEGPPTLRGVPKHPRVNPGTILQVPRLSPLLAPARLAALQKLARNELWNLEEKYDVDIERFFGTDRISFEAETKALVFLNWNIQVPDPPRLVPVNLSDRSDLIPLIRKAPGALVNPWFASDRSGFAAPSADGYCRSFATVPCYELTGGVDFPAAAEMCLTLLPG